MTLTDLLYKVKWDLYILFRFKSIKMVFNSDIKTMIPKSTRILHNGQGVVIGGNCVIGENCVIRQNVTIGNKTVNGVRGSPIVKDNVNIFPFTVICGSCVIGNNVTIGAFTYIDKDVPDDCYVRGIPFKVLKKFKYQKKQT